jgi:Fe-S cluster assembly iron-binding protein IscA
MTVETPAGAPGPITLTPAAVAETARLLAEEEPGVALRVKVRVGECSGLRYQLYLSSEYKHVVERESVRGEDGWIPCAETEQVAAEQDLLAARQDSITWFGRVPVLIDANSRAYLLGASLDYVMTARRQGFTIDNPAAAGSCACGDSIA